MLKFDINLLWTFINLIIFFVFMRLVLFKPIKKVLDKRQELIDKNLDDAKKASDDAQSIKSEYQEKMSDYKSEGKQIIAKAQGDARLEYNKIVERANNEADRIKSDAVRASKIETENAKRAVKEEIASLAIETAEKVVEREVSPELDSDIYDKFLSESSDE